MKKSISLFLTYIGMLLMAVALGSCQEEHEELPIGGDHDAIKASSTTGKLIRKASSKNGSFDDIVDGAGCFAINFPYVVHVGGAEITVGTPADLKKIEKVFDEIDDDILDIVFPITITLSDFSEIKINDSDQLEDLVEECMEGGDDDDIECIDFVYPLTLYSFNIDLQQTGKLTVENDMQLRRYFGGLDDDDLISFEFPIALKLYGKEEVLVNNNAELADAIEKADDACDDDFSQEAVEKYLVICPWSIKEIKRGGQDKTAQYSQFILSFITDGRLVAKDGSGNDLTGNWSAMTVGKEVKLKLTFEGLDDFSMDWSVDDLGEGEIELKEGEGNEIELLKACE